MIHTRQRRLWTPRVPLPLVLMFLCLLAIAPTVCFAQVTPGSILSVQVLEVIQPAEIERLAKPLFTEAGFSVPSMRYAVEVYSLRYLSTDHDGSSVKITAQFFVPRFVKQTARPVYVFGSGTTGIADSCAPSLEPPDVRRWGWYRQNMLAYAGLGFIVIFPDYIGFNDSDRPQRYFSKLAEGHVMLDAARAVFRFFEFPGYAVKPAPAVFLAGYSQGGHAAFAGADLRSVYAPEVPLAGVIGYGSTNNIETLFKEAPVYAPHILYTYSLIYGFDKIDPADYLQDRWVRTLEADVNRMCVEKFQIYYPTDGNKLYRPEFYRALHENRLGESYPALAACLAENLSGLSGHRVPALIVQGTADIVITTSSQDRYVNALRRAKSSTQYVVLEDVRHKHTRAAGFLASVEWMELIFRGEAPPSNELNHSSLPLLTPAEMLAASP
jgi:pimeloyl-ACP methyl ester carboxylesterase